MASNSTKSDDTTTNKMFSRRHETNKAHRATQDRRAGVQDAKMAAVASRDKVRAGRSAAQQLQELDSRLGKGVGATKERTLLANQMATA